MKKSSFLVFLVLFAVGSTTAVGAQRYLDSSMLHFGEAKQFFFDNLIIEGAQNLTRRVHKPVKDQRSPLIQKDRTWEHVTYFTVSAWRVIRDPEDGLFKCWYEDWQYQAPLEHDEYLHDATTNPSRYLFAHSRDGVHWEKPLLDVVKEDGRKTNIVFGDPEFGSVHSGYVFLDPLEKKRERRYKMFFNHRTPQFTRYEIASSPDGIHWTPWEDLPTLGWLGPHLGDVLTVSVDQYAHVYRLNTRHPWMNTVAHHPGDPFHPSYPRSPVEQSSFIHPVYPEDFSRQNRRRIFRSESSDLLHWTNLQPLVVPDDQLDNIDDAFYGMTQFRVGNNWVGFLHVLHMTENTLDVQLLFSRDGTHFQRVQPGQPWLETGSPGSWDELMVNIYGAPVTVDDEIYLYYGGSNNHHDWWITGARENLDVPEGRDLSQVNYSLGLARIKVDRFVSLRSLPVREGILVTRPFRSEGTQLFVNAQSRAGGYVKVAVADANGKVIPGFEAENCTEFQGDSVSHRVSWKDKKEIPTGRGFVKLHFFMKDADLFSFQLRK